MRIDYAPSSYDDYFCLKPSLLLWLSMVYLSRAIVLPLVAGIARYAGVGPDAFSLLHSALSVETLVSSAVAIPVLYAAFRRMPSAYTTTRWIWAHGRVFLAVAASLDLLLSLIPAVRHGDLDDLTLTLVLGWATDAFILLYVVVARRARDSFAAFPPQLDLTPTK